MIQCLVETTSAPQAHAQLHVNQGNVGQLLDGLVFSQGLVKISLSPRLICQDDRGSFRSPVKPQLFTGRKLSLLGRRLLTPRSRHLEMPGIFPGSVGPVARPRQGACQVVILSACS